MRPIVVLQQMGHVLARNVSVDAACSALALRVLCAACVVPSRFAFFGRKLFSATQHGRARELKPYTGLPARESKPCTAPQAKPETCVQCCCVPDHALNSAPSISGRSGDRARGRCRTGRKSQCMPVLAVFQCLSSHNGHLPG